MNIEFEKYIKDTLEAKQLKSAYDFIFDEIESKGIELQLNQYIKTANLETVKEWEIYLDIPEDTSLTLDERKGVVLLKLFQKPPYTLANVKKQILSIVGAETQIRFDYVVNKLTIMVNNLTEYANKMISLYLDGVKPANVIYELIEWANTWQEAFLKHSWETAHTYTWEEAYTGDDFK